MKEKGNSRHTAAGFSKEILWNRVGREEVQRSEWEKMKGSLVCTLSLGHLPFQGHALMGDSALQGQTRKDIGVPQVSWAEILMQSDVEVMFVCIFIQDSGWLSQYSPWQRSGFSTFSPILHLTSMVEDTCGQCSPSPGSCTVVGDRCQGQPAFHLSFLVKALPWAQILTFTVCDKVLTNKQRFELAQAWSKCQVHLCSLLHLHQEPGLDPVWSLQCRRLYGSGETELINKELLNFYQFYNTM